jgi:general secretion pathway protein G
MKLKIRNNHGFTLLEIMLVVMIIALLAGSAIYLMGGNLGYAQSVRVKSDIQAITTQLKLYQAMNGFLPTTEQGLQALTVRPDSDPKPTQWRKLMDKVMMDPWQNPYIYENPGKHNQDTFDLYSAGPDRKQGTDDDIGNWDSTTK